MVLWFLMEIVRAIRADDVTKVGVSSSVAEVRMKKAKMRRAAEDERILR